MCVVDMHMSMLIYVTNYNNEKFWAVGNIKISQDSVAGPNQVFPLFWGFGKFYFPISVSYSSFS